MLQMDIAWEDKSSNMARAENYLLLLPEDTDLWVLPEMFTSGFSNNVTDMSETMEGETLLVLKRWSRDRNMAICGSLIIQEEAHYYNRFVFVHPNGTVETYDKAHLFPFGEEDENYIPGKQRIIIEYKGWRIFPQVCYDLRFPIWSRNTMNYDLCIYVASWPAPRDHVWRTLLMARAIENMCYTIGVNRVGHDGNNIDYNGQSLISDAKGTIITPLSEKETQLIASVSLNDLHEFRNKFPVLEDQDNFEIILE